MDPTRKNKNMANEFIKIGSHIINLNHIAFINLHGAKYDYETKANISGGSPTALER